MRVLLVEDSPRLQRFLGAALRQSGYAVDMAVDGEQGLWLAEANSAAAVVLDIMLPKIDGLTIVRLPCTKGRNKHTAKDTVEDRVRGLADGADDYLVKPFALEELLARVHAQPGAAVTRLTNCGPASTAEPGMNGACSRRDPRRGPGGIVQ